MKRLLSLLSFILFFSACEKQTVETPQTANNKIDFSKLVAIGSSTTSGFMNGGLYRDGQLSAFPNLIAQQAGISFEQALFPMGQENGTGYFANPLGNNYPPFSKISDKTAFKSSNSPLLAKFSGNLNNLSVSNLKLSEVGKTGLGNSTKSGFNPFFERVLGAGKEDLSYIDFVKEAKPSFFLMNLGETDLMEYINSGGTKTITEASVFALNCQKLLDGLGTTKGVIANLPNPIDSPYLSFITFEAVSHTVGFHGGVYITTGNGIARLATIDDYVMLDKINSIGQPTAGKQKGTMAFPVPNEEVLDKSEITTILNQVNDYNGILKAEAVKRNIPIVDLNSTFKEIKDKKYDAGNSVKVDNSIFTGGFFSLDGSHPTPRGQAIIANEFIKVINTSYKNILEKPITLLDVSKFESIRTLK